MAKTISPGLRILIGASSFADAAAALRIVEHLPATYRAALGGVFVEETHMLATCRLPNRRVVTNSGMTLLAPNPAQIRTVLHAEARAFRQSLKDAGADEAREDLFVRQEGELVHTALRVAEGWDILVVGYRPVHAMRGRIILLRGAGPPSDQMRLASQSLAQQHSTQCLSFRFDPDTPADTAMPASPNQTFPSLDAVLHALARTNAHAVLVDLQDGPIQTPDDLARVLEAARCPLIVFGASHPIATLEHNMQVPPAPAYKGRMDGH
ncbi:MAG: hypothetical protein AB8B60_19600 [Sulfitobacter sp.]